MLWLLIAGFRKPWSDTLRSWVLYIYIYTFWFIFLCLLDLKPFKLPPLSSPLQQWGANRYSFSQWKMIIFSKPPDTKSWGFQQTSPYYSESCLAIQSYLFSFLPATATAVFITVQRAERELRASRGDSMLPLTVRRHSRNVLPLQNLLVLLMEWNLYLNFYLYWILANDKIIPQNNGLYETRKERIHARYMIN